MEKQYLWDTLGKTIQRGLRNDDVFEIMLNPDYTVWFKHRVQGNVCVGTMDRHKANTFVHALAQLEGKYLNRRQPYFDGTLSFRGERINVTIPPIVDQVSFNIRKKSKVIFSLDDYVTSEVITPQQAHVLTQAVRERKNILISGSPAAGKTTFANALLGVIADVADVGERVLLLEQVPELQCQVKNVKTLLVSDRVSMNQLLWIAMRNSPDRLVIGEVRDGAALDLLKAWNTGCSGGLATVHANSARAAVQRVLDLACETIANPPMALTAEAIDMMVHIEANAKHPAKRVVTEIVKLTGFDRDTQQFLFKTI